MGQHSEAFALLRRALDMARARGEKDAFPALLRNLEKTTRPLAREAWDAIQKDPERALGTALEIEQAAREHQLWLDLQIALGIRGLALQELDRVPEALSCFEEKAAICRRTSDFAEPSQALTMQALAHVAMKQLELAIVRLEERVRVCKESSDRAGVTDALTLLADLRTLRREV